MHCARDRAETKGWACTIDLPYVLSIWNAQDGRCVYTGMQMTHHRSGHKSEWFPTNVSLDRINSRRGYVRGNVQLVCNWANHGRGCMTDARFKELLRVAGKFQNQTDGG